MAADHHAYSYHGKINKQRTKETPVSNEELEHVTAEETVFAAEPVAISQDSAPEEPPAQKVFAEKKKKSVPPAAQSAAVSGNATDDVLLSQCVYKNKFARKSLTVHHVQRRLVEWGYVDAGTDKDGWYGDHTARAVAAFQAAHGLDGSGQMNADTLTALFEGDHNVALVI